MTVGEVLGGRGDVLGGEGKRDEAAGAGDSDVEHAQGFGGLAPGEGCSGRYGDCAGGPCGEQVGGAVVVREER